MPHDQPLAFLRPDGRKGIRNVLTVVYLVECAHHVAREIAYPFREEGTQVIGFSGCYPNAYAQDLLQRLCTHPNVGAVLLVSLGCEGFDRSALSAAIEHAGRPCKTLVIQEAGGTRSSIAAGRDWVRQTLQTLARCPRVPFSFEDLIVGTICGGSDAASGISANPAVGFCFDRLVESGARCIFEETGELIGCEEDLANRAARPELRQPLLDAVVKAARYYETLGHGSFAPGNAEGGLTTQEEKSLGAYCKSGSSPVMGILKPGNVPVRGGLYLLDVVPDGEVRFGFPNINDNAEIAELIACGAHVIVFTTGRGSVVGSAISPVIKVCSNPETFARMEEDMDINAGLIVEGKARIEDVGSTILEHLRAVVSGQPSKSEGLGHQEFVMTYKSFEPAGPSCFPA